MELKARFDEDRNIEWSRALEQAGVHVVYGFPEPQDPREDDSRRTPRGRVRCRRYVHLGTGNYHALTARLYEDFGLFTADEDIAADVADLFNHLTGFARAAALPQAPRRAVRPAPARLVELIRGVVGAAAEAGKTARHPRSR